jgi:hypothetical protein
VVLTILSTACTGYPTHRIHRGGDAQIQNRLAAKLSTRVAERRQSLTSSGQPHSAPAAVADAVLVAGNGHAPRVHGLPGAERASLAGGKFRRVTSDGVVQVQEEAGGAQGRSDEIERRPPPPCTEWTRRVPHTVLIGHAASLTPY